MQLEIEEVLARGERKSKAGGSTNRQEEIYFDGKVYLAAKELVRCEEVKLFMLIKKYIEQNRERSVEMTEIGIKGYKSGMIRSFQEKIEIEDFFITLKFNADPNGDWEYTISSGELKIKDLAPPQNKDMAIQGQLNIEFFCKTSDNAKKTKKQTIVMKSYS